MKQLTKEEASSFYESKIYENWDSEQIVRFQLFQERLCVPFELFASSMSDVLNRPVYTHEFAYPDLLKSEYLGSSEAPTLDEIINLIPEEKRLIIAV